MTKISKLILITYLLISTNLVFAQEVTKLDEKTYEKQDTTTINIADKKSECDAIQAQANGLLARLADCKIEISTVVNSEIGRPVEVPDAEPIEVNP